jgi:hypothetical protein
MPSNQWLTSRSQRASEPRDHQDERATVQDEQSADPADSQALEQRPVRVDEPDLSERTNERLTEELRETVRARSVGVPADRPHASTGDHPESRSWLHVLTLHRLVFGLTLAMLLTIAAIVALSNGDWWLLPLACVVHAAGRMLVLTFALRMTRDMEHPSPTLAAAMTEEGIASPDLAFSEMVEEFRSPEAEDLDQLQNARTITPQEDPATATAQQARAVTPSSQPSRPSTGASASEVVVVVLAFAFSVDAFVIPLCSGGHWLWLIPAIVVPICVALTLVRRTIGPSDQEK